MRGGIVQKVVLASTSPRRKAILKKFRIKFRQIAPHVNEQKIMRKLKNKNPYIIANVTAYEKAKSVLKKVKKGIVIGSDTIVVLGSKIIGKPKSRKDAEKTLRALSNSTHRVITGLAFIDAETGKAVVCHDETKIIFKKMSIKQIRSYIISNNVMDKAGAYAIQEGADPFVKRYVGSYYNIVGLPIEKLKKVLNCWNKI